MKLLICLLFIIWLPLNAQENPIYRVQKGDEIGVIANSLGLYPLWGKDGYVQKILELNKDSLKNSNYIKTDQLIKLPKSYIYLCNIERAKQFISIKYKIKTSNDKNYFLANKNNCLDSPKIDQVSEVSKALKPTPTWIDGIEVYGMFSEFSITDNSTDAVGKINPEANYGFNIYSYHSFSKNLFAKYFLNLEQQNYAEIPNRTLNKKDFFLYNFGTQIKKRLTQSIYSVLDIIIGNELYIDFPTTSEVSIEETVTLKSNYGIGFELLNMNNYQLLSEVGLKAILGRELDGFDSNTGLGYSTRLILNKLTKYKNYYGALSFENIDKSTTNFDQDETQIKFGIGVTWDTGDYEF